MFQCLQLVLEQYPMPILHLLRILQAITLHSARLMTMLHLLFHLVKQANLL